MTHSVDTLETEADRAAALGHFDRAVALLESALEASPDRSELWSKLSAMRRASSNFVGAMQAIDHALALEPLDFTSLLARATLLESARSDQSGAAYCEALAQLREGEEIPPFLEQTVTLARTKCDRHRQSIEARLAAIVPDYLSAPEQANVDRFIRNASRRLRVYHQEPTHFHYPGLPEREFHDVANFSGLASIAEAAPVIREEFDALIASEGATLVPYIQYSKHIALRQWEQLNHNRDWSALHLIQNGVRVDANARHCPRTLEVLSRLDQPDIPGASPNILFSLLAPHTRIPPHTGVANTRLVVHLPLIVPERCGFRCGATVVEWRPGIPFVFDDTIEHEAWNESDQLRVVLIFDLWAPRLSKAERQAISVIITAVGGGAAL